MKVDQVRRFALSLPGANEQPHFELTSFRIHKKIFATITPDEVHLHIFIDPAKVRSEIGNDPKVYEELWWGKKLVGLKVLIASAGDKPVCKLLEDAWSLRAPKGPS